MGLDLHDVKMTTIMKKFGGELSATALLKELRVEIVESESTNDPAASDKKRCFFVFLFCYYFLYHLFFFFLLLLTFFSLSLFIFLLFCLCFFNYNVFVNEYALLSNNTRGKAIASD